MFILLFAYFEVFLKTIRLKGGSRIKPKNIMHFALSRFGIGPFFKQKIKIFSKHLLPCLSRYISYGVEIIAEVSSAKSIRNISFMLRMISFIKIKNKTKEHAFFIREINVFSENWNLLGTILTTNKPYLFYLFPQFTSSLLCLMMSKA